MSRVVAIYLILSVLVSVTASAPELDFDESSDDSVDLSTPAPSATISATASRSTIEEFLLGHRTTAVSTIESTYKNWVGPLTKSPNTACYRESHFGKTCPHDFNHKMGMCWAQCPLAYPVKCGMECIRQNDDCALEIVTKVAVVVQATVAMGAFNLYGQFKLMAKAVQTAFRCVKDLSIFVRQFAKVIRSIKVSDPQTPQDKLLLILYYSDKFIFDLPVTIASCMGIIVKPNVRFADKILNTAELVTREVMVNADSILDSWDSFKGFMKRVLLGQVIANVTETEITSLTSALKSNTTCGYDLKRLADRTWMTVLALRKRNPDMSENELRVEISKSSLVLNEIPIATNNCMKELVAESDETTAYATRMTLRKTFGVIVEDLIKSGTSDNGTFYTAEQYAYNVADKAFAFWGVWDIKGITSMIGEYFQTICGPTKFMGEIDDGPAADALGLSAVGKAFNGSFGNWTKEGDGTVTINFQSSDTEDVTVNILSAGDKVDEVDVSAGGSATWSSNVSALGGKTLYLDRWRPGLLGLPGTGGGSLLLWVPRASQGGNLELNVKLNVS
ncbi:hypothetical protein PHYSODRAFT_330145 [Phytophthora sojae]|uniref:Uncharacterized protein n=1 Tax=Phytophthora sojae (strain P6497) TaxID=1094619 RepID=G4Z5L1_PHYSP|nr:hypothetical protein PHYSODRAFT_330145 [Phytophthora sojae]EGZ22325.1 hypothetical protein PHYSODRAFT_330145 [Phytophthora sojae]|eukprot:XP_009525042.1 hypothetical protein PHYSODRAFT_330145 [Phytophthora sojae]